MVSSFYHLFATSFIPCILPRRHGSIVLARRRHRNVQQDSLGMVFFSPLTVTPLASATFEMSLELPRHSHTASHRAYLRGDPNALITTDWLCFCA